MRIKAYYPPQAPDSAYRIYSFIRSNDNLVTTAGGMTHVITGLDKSRLAQIAPHYGIDFERIIPYVSKYESEMLKRQQRTLDNK